MTMDNGEGRPLDEDETGNEDPQGWYFDLPGGAWERQEEKNRMLRQRVLGNIEEDAEKAKGDPFSKKFELRPQQEPKFELRRPEPEQPKKRGLFGFGKKKSEDPVTPEPPRGLELHETDEDWNTEPPLKLSPFPRPAAESARAPWAESGGGWDLGEGREATPPEEDEASTPEDFASGIRAWAHGEAPAAPAHEAPTEVTRDDDDDFASGIRAWAHGGPEHVPTGQTSFTHEDAADDPPAEDWGASNTSREEAGSLPGDSLRLRPRAHQDDEKHLDWNFGPAAWGEKEEQAPAEVESLEDDEGALESMRKWAERSREQDHPHFTTAAHPQDEAEAPLPPPIPLRPRHHDDADQPAAHHPSTPVAGPGELEPPQALPIRLRSRTEPPEERPRREATEGPSKWDDFFNLKRDDDAPAGTSDEEDDIAAAEGLAAMREWASKRPEPDAPVDIPEEFLKPFDWELQEEVPEAPAEFRKPFDWEDTTPDAADATGAGATEEWSDTVEDDETASFREPLPFPARPVLEEAAVSPAVPELEDEDDDPLAGLFDQAPATPAPPKKKGRFGRLFGRGKDKAAPEPVLEDTGEPGDWVLPGEDQQDDVRTVAAAEWLEDAGSAAPDPTEDAPDAGVAGWGAALAASQATLDEEVADFSAALTAREGDPEATAEFEVPDFDLEPAATEEAAPEVLWAPQLPTFADPVEVSPPADETGAASHPAEEAAATREASSDEAWDPEPVTFEVNVAPWEATEDTEPEAPAPVEAVASVEESPEPEQPAAAGWQEAVTGAPAPGVAAASFEAPTPASYDDDDPWADFVARPAASVPEPPPLPPAWGATPAAPRDEDMWGDIAATAEQAAHSSPDIDLAASLESQMAEQSEPAFGWAQRGPDRDERSWDAAPAIEAAPPSPSEEEDVILAAFERHAATPESPEARREQDEAFAELLGEQAADIVSEVSEEDTGRSFIRMTGWAPQRSASDFDGGWAPQQEVEETLARNQRPFNFGGIDGDAFAPPSWAVDEMEPDEVPASARRGHRTRTWIREIVETGLLAFLVFLSVRASFQNFKVEGSSMYPTLEDGQFLIVNKLVYSEVDLDKLGKFVPFVDGGNDPERNVFHGPERGDIVVLIDPRNPETDLIKRVIGLPGETVEIVDGKVYINDRLLEEPYIKSEWHDTRPKITVPPDEYFVMGDNRDNSLDSRNSQVSTVPKDLIIGKAMLSYWPSSKFGFAPNASPDLTDDKPVLTSKRIGDD